MNKDTVKGKMKDLEGRFQRQAGEWTGSTEDQAKGIGKQIQGKAQNMMGKAKDAGKKATERVSEKSRDIERDAKRHEGSDFRPASDIEKDEEAA